MLRAYAGREIGAAKDVARRCTMPYRNHVFADLTAGDGVAHSGTLWTRGCSPGIFAHLAADGKRPHRVLLCEQNQRVYVRLLEQLHLQLPRLGYESFSPSLWVHPVNRATVTALHGDARKLVTFDDVERGEWVFFNNDPNNIQGWALDIFLLRRLLDTGQRFGTFMATMGCNVGGLKRLPLADREAWFGHIRHVVQLNNAFGRLDLLLFEVQNDKSQWAYLAMVPRKWRQETVVRLVRVFLKAGLAVAPFSFETDESAFRGAIDRLFLTRKEREGRA